MTKVLVISDDGIPSGYGRISMEVNTRLVRRGYNIMAASLYYDGLLPPGNDGQGLPYWVASLASKNGAPNDWPGLVGGIIAAFQPDIVHVVQDAPYAEALRNAPIDWSRHAFVVTTPVDGTPIYPNWVNMLKGADGTLSISEFGVATHKAAGIPSALCRPGIDPNVFFSLPDAARTALRARLGLAPDAFLLMTAAQNQGRKDIPTMLRAFFKFASDKATARYLLDMDATSPAGWDIPALCDQFGWDAGKLIFRGQAARAGLVELRDRYRCADVHLLISHREGYGLPQAEAMACGVCNVTLDYCSGTEICADGRGVLIAPLDHDEISTWGGALDKLADASAVAAALQRLYDNPDERRGMAVRGQAWAQSQSWDAAAGAVQGVYDRVLAKRTPAALTAQAVVA